MYANTEITDLYAEYPRSDLHASGLVILYRLIKMPDGRIFNWREGSVEANLFAVIAFHYEMHDFALDAEFSTLAAPGLDDTRLS